MSDRSVARPIRAESGQVGFGPLGEPAPVTVDAEAGHRLFGDVDADTIIRQRLKWLNASGNPSCARGWYHSGFLRLMAGNPNRAIELADISLRLSPRTRSGPVHTLIGASAG